MDGADDSPLFAAHIPASMQKQATSATKAGVACFLVDALKVGNSLQHCSGFGLPAAVAVRKLEPQPHVATAFGL